MYISSVLYSIIFALSMERTWLTFHCWLYTLCIIMYVTKKKSWILNIIQYIEHRQFWKIHRLRKICLHSSTQWEFKTIVKWTTHTENQEAQYSFSTDAAAAKLQESNLYLIKANLTWLMYYSCSRCSSQRERERERGRGRETDSKTPDHQRLCGPIRKPGTLHVGGTFGERKRNFQKFRVWRVLKHLMVSTIWKVEIKMCILVQMSDVYATSCEQGLYIKTVLYNAVH